MSEKKQMNIASEIPADGIYDARTLGKAKMTILGIQHMFAMFGATILVPMITGLDTATTLLMAGLGTLLFHLLSKGKVPAFLGSSFAFLGGYAAVKGWAADYNLTESEMLPYACLGVACAGLLYVVLAAIIRAVGISKVMQFFPPVVTGPIIIAIGLGLAGSAVDNCKSSWPIALIALGVVIIFNIWGKGMAKIIPIILGVLISYAAAVILGLLFPNTFTPVDFTPITDIIRNIGEGHLYGEDALFCIPIFSKKTVFGGVDWSNTSLVISSIVAIMPISLATMMEHIGDICAISSTCKRNYVEDPGLHRTLLGDGLATTMASLFGGPANTTYGENTGVLALSKVYDPRVVRIAAVFACGISFFPIVSAAIATIPSAIIGGISFVLYGMISAVGVRNIVENQVDFSKSRNLIIAAIILVSALGLGSVDFNIFGLSISLSALAVASIAGIVLNAILPGKDYTFENQKEA